MRLLRILLAFVSSGILIWQVCSMIALLHSIESATSVPAVPYNDAVQKGVEVLLDQSRSWAQVTALLLGALAALWVAKGEETRLAFSRRLWPEIVMWCAGVLMLGAGLYCHNEYLDSVATALEAGGKTSAAGISIPDLFDKKYESLRGEQFALLVYGTLASVLAIVSVRHFSGRDDVEE